MLKRAPDCFVEISTKRIIAEKLHSQTGRADEGPQIPRELRPEKKIAAEPTKQNRTGCRVAASHSSQQVEQPPIRRDPGEGNGEDMREQYHAVSDDRVCRSKRRRIVENKERDRTERAENQGRDRETHQNCERSLLEGKAGTEKLRKDSVERTVPDASQKD